MNQREIKLLLGLGVRPISTTDEPKASHGASKEEVIEKL